MSTTHESLQKCITRLEHYCKTWQLEVNLKKTKIMIFNKQGSLIKKYKFYYKNNTLENVKEYKYLGFTFTCSGSDNIGIQNLLKQAKKKPGFLCNITSDHLKIKQSQRIYIYLTLK